MTEFDRIRVDTRCLDDSLSRLDRIIGHLGLITRRNRQTIEMNGGGYAEH